MYCEVTGKQWQKSRRWWYIYISGYVLFSKQSPVPKHWVNVVLRLSQGAGRLICTLLLLFFLEQLTSCSSATICGVFREHVATHGGWVSRVAHKRSNHHFTFCCRCHGPSYPLLFLTINPKCTPPSSVTPGVVFTDKQHFCHSYTSSLPYKHTNLGPNKHDKRQQSNTSRIERDQTNKVPVFWLRYDEYYVHSDRIADHTKNPICSLDMMGRDVDT